MRQCSARAPRPSLGAKGDSGRDTPEQLPRRTHRHMHCRAKRKQRLSASTHAPSWYSLSTSYKQSRVRTRLAICLVTSSATGWSRCAFAQQSAISLWMMQNTTNDKSETAT
jgi:hypothetical protein